MIIKDNKSISVNKQPLSLKSNSLWNLLGSLVYALTQWGVLIVIAKLGTPEMVGIFTLALALTAPMVLFFRFNLRSVVASDSNNDFSFNDYYTLRILTTILFIITTISISLVYLPKWNTVLVLMIFSIAKAVESISDILHGQMQKNERLDITAKSRIIKGIFSLFLFSVIMYLTSNLALATLGYLLSWLIILFVYDYPKTSMFGKFSFKLNKKQLKYLFILSIPLGFAQLIASLNANVPRYFLEYFYEPSVLGFFGAIIYIVTAGNNFVMAVSGAVIPRLSNNYYKRKVKEYYKLLSGFMLIVILSSILAMIVVKFYGEEILTLLYTSEYSVYSQELFYAFVLSSIIYSNKVLETGLTSTREFKVQPYINIITLVIIVISSLFYIPNYGILGAIISIGIGELLQFIIRTLVLIKILNRRGRP